MIDVATLRKLLNNIVPLLDPPPPKKKLNKCALHETDEEQDDRYSFGSL